MSNDPNDPVDPPKANNPKDAEDLLQRIIKDDPDAWGFKDAKEKGDFLGRIYTSIEEARRKMGLG